MKIVQLRPHMIVLKLIPKVTKKCPNQLDLRVLQIAKIRDFANNYYKN